MKKVVFEIVESPVIGDPLAPLRMQEGPSMVAPPTHDWRELLQYHIMKNIENSEPHSFARQQPAEQVDFHSLAEDAFDPSTGDLARLVRELQGMGANVRIRQFRVNDEGELEEF